MQLETRDQANEHVDGGTVGEILVRGADRVESGDALMRLDDTLLRSEEAKQQAELAELGPRRNSLEAELRDSEAITLDGDLGTLALRDGTGNSRRPKAAVRDTAPISGGAGGAVARAHRPNAQAGRRV